jgi:hypothetical protein
LCFRMVSTRRRRAIRTKEERNQLVRQFDLVPRGDRTLWLAQRGLTWAQITYWRKLRSKEN